MATAVAVAIRQQEAVGRIQKTAKTLAKRFELRLVDLAPAHRDAAVERAAQLEAIAALLEDIDKSTRALDLREAPAEGAKRKGDAK